MLNVKELEEQNKLKYRSKEARNEMKEYTLFEKKSLILKMKLLRLMEMAKMLDNDHRNSLHKLSHKQLVGRVPVFAHQKHHHQFPFQFLTFGPVFV